MRQYFLGRFFARQQRLFEGGESIKRVLSVLLVAVMLACLIPCFAAPVSADSLYIRKIVSVVYDDSGSMAGDKWACANYAMQAFCGMLNSED